MQRRGRTRQRHLALLMIVMVGVGAGCQSSDAKPGTVETIPDTTVPSTQQQATTTTVLSDEEAAYNVYRSFLDAAALIGGDLNKRPDDGSLDPYTTPSFRTDIVRNLEALKRNGLTLKGQIVTRPLGGQRTGDTMKLRVCVRDDVDQIDRTGKQLTPPGPGIPQVGEIRLVRQGSSWLLENSKGIADRCDV